MLFELAKLREKHQEAQDAAKRAQEVLETEPLWQKVQSFKTDAAMVGELVSKLETEIRNEATLDYLDNGIKDLGGVQIKNFTVLEYDEQEAVNYCLEHQHATLLKLDKRGFEKVAKELRPEFVRIEEVARAQIATDLSDYLEK
ncbi:MAG: hypothetical protein WC998_01650 [Candidatus Paceibacterota bacterium]|jgi:hypothetical protein